MSGAGNCPMRPSFKEHYAVINTALFDENACGRCLKVSAEPMRPQYSSMFWVDALTVTVTAWET
uniref:Uncharacterized protein n=1 Tax=Globisporangium ultimum (strain ATCC 200006 / CBS 805.95 / DAOM BR144) TaxID=431595 RepID=K3WWZ8_GLOUD